MTIEERRFVIAFGKEYFTIVEKHNLWGALGVMINGEFFSDKSSAIEYILNIKESKK